MLTPGHKCKDNKWKPIPDEVGTFRTYQSFSKRVQCDKCGYISVEMTVFKHKGKQRVDIGE